MSLWDPFHTTFPHIACSVKDDKSPIYVDDGTGWDKGFWSSTPIEIVRQSICLPETLLEARSITLVFKHAKERRLAIHCFGFDLELTRRRSAIVDVVLVEKRHNYDEEEKDEPTSTQAQEKQMVLVSPEDR